MKIQELLQTTALTELKMSPSSLKTMAARIPGALVGMEFEMYVPNVAGVGGEEDYDLDLEMDGYIDDSSWRAFVDDVANFFSSGEFAEGGRQYFVRQIENNVMDEWINWSTDKFYEWARDGAFEEWYKKENPDADEVPESGREFEDAMDEFRDEAYNDFVEDEGSIRNFLEAEGMQRYYDLSSRYGWSWPHLTSGGSSGDVDMETVAEDFSDAVGIPVNVSTSYHGRSKSTTAYTVEPDSSLDRPESSEDGGLEFVSPPLPIDEMIDQLKKVKRWAGGYGAYTNKSCGLHINVSVPGFDLKKLDYVKLALFVGDDYVAKQFDRLGVTWAKSSLEKVKQAVKSDPDRITSYLDVLRQGLAKIASKLIHSGETEKYVTLNTKDNRVEFRAPGGDWLDSDLDKVIITMLRFVVALDIAMDPEKEKREYFSKMYKLLDGAKVIEDTDTIKHFAQFSAKQIPKGALKSYVRYAQERRKEKKQSPDSKPGKGIRVRYMTIPDGKESTIDIPAGSRREAEAEFKQSFPSDQFQILKMEELN